MPKHYPNRFAVDEGKRAAIARGRPLAAVLKELVANSLDAGATKIELTCAPTPDRRRDRAGLRAFDYACSDNGHGCHNPEILRTIGSSTEDLNPETRGRFGQGLIDVLAASKSASIEMLNHRLRFDAIGCVISHVRKNVKRTLIAGTLLHPEEDVDHLRDYFHQIIVPAGVSLSFNGNRIEPRDAFRRVEGLQLQTVVFDKTKGHDRKFSRMTAVELVSQFRDPPTIHELGIPVDDAPFSLPFDINVLQKTPLDTARNMLPAAYKLSLVRQLVAHVNDQYQAYMERHDEVPDELRNDPESAERLDEPTRNLVIRKTYDANLEDIVRENPFEMDNDSETAELKARHGKTPVSLRTAPRGIAMLLRETPTVAETHHLLCKAHFTPGQLPPETARQRLCLSMFSELASALVGRKVTAERVAGGSVAATWSNGRLMLNSNTAYLWDDPLGEESIALILHECAHDRVSGHSLEFHDEVARLGGRLAAWIANHVEWWHEWNDRLYDIK